MHYLGIPYMVEQSHYGFYGVFDSDGEINIEPILEGIILHKYFKFNPKCK